MSIVFCILYEPGLVVGGRELGSYVRFNVLIANGSKDFASAF